jgi:probable HAF family extracellular repeat protein
VRTLRSARWIGACIGAVSLLACSTRVGAQAVAYSVTDLGETPGATGGTFAVGINDRSQVAASSFFSFTSPYFQAFLWQDGNIIVLPGLGGSSSLANGINAPGEIAGEASLPGDLVTHATLWSHGQVTDLRTLGGVNSFAGNVNSHGQVTGTSEIATSGVPVDHAFLWQRDVMSDLQTLGGNTSFAFAINEQAQITGQSDVSTALDPTFGIPVFHGFLWDGGEMADLGLLLGGNFSYGQDMNNELEIVGAADLLGDLSSHGYLWRKGVVTDLGVAPGDTSSGAFGINNNGQIVGISALAPNDFFLPPAEEFLCPCHAALWVGGQAVDLNTLIPANSGWQLTLATGINDHGQIVGQGTFNNSQRSFLLTPLEAPANNVSAPGSTESVSSGGTPRNVASVIMRHGKTRFVMQNE